MRGQGGSAFVVMGYSVSDLQDSSFPVGVIIAHHLEEDTRLAIYAAIQPTDCFLSVNQRAHEEVDAFFIDVCACPIGNQSKRLFQHLCELGIGPIRMVGRSIAKPDASEIDDEIGIMCAGLWRDVLWPSSFIQL